MSNITTIQKMMASAIIGKLNSGHQILETDFHRAGITSRDRRKELNERLTQVHRMSNSSVSSGSSGSSTSNVTTGYSAIRHQNSTVRTAPIPQKSMTPPVASSATIKNTVWKKPSEIQQIQMPLEQQVPDRLKSLTAMRSSNIKNIDDISIFSHNMLLGSPAFRTFNCK